MQEQTAAKVIKWKWWSHFAGLPLF